MRLFEKCVYKSEIAPATRNNIGPDQFAYKKGHNSTMALIKSQHQWLEWMDKNANYVRVLSFDFQAFDSVPHDLLFEKVKKLLINPYVVNWLISFLENRIQRVMVDGITTEYLYINRGVPQGTVLGPVLFSIMVDDIKTLGLCAFYSICTHTNISFDRESLKIRAAFVILLSWQSTYKLCQTSFAVLLNLALER